MVSIWSRERGHVRGGEVGVISGWDTHIGITQSQEECEGQSEFDMK